MLSSGLKMAENPQKEYWKHTWTNALNNMPHKLNVSGCRRANGSGSRATLMRVLGLDMTKTNQNYKDYPIVYNGFTKGVPPKDQEVCRKLEICAGPYGRMLAWLKLKELGLAEKYEKPR
jgi:hypothetical protein